MQRTRFGDFVLDPDDRTLTRDGAAVPLNARYFDALALLVGEAGRLVTKERFHDEVWRSIPVTDEALTQCIRSLRRELSDDAARPRFIETVPKHGYRFVAAVEAAPSGSAPPPVSSEHRPAASRLPRALAVFASGVTGAALAGLVGGTLYGAILADGSSAGDGVSMVLVIASLTLLIALIGGAGVSGGIALVAYAADRPGSGYWVGGAAGGFLTGALVRLVGLDAFALLLGAAPRDMTGGSEGALLGAVAGVGAWMVGTRRPLRIVVPATAAAAAVVGAVIALARGKLLAGSLAALADSFGDSRLDLASLGGLFGEQGFGPVTAGVTAAAEAALFVGCFVAGVGVALRRASSPPPAP